VDRPQELSCRGVYQLRSAAALYGWAART